MLDNLEDQIRLRAYQLWELAGKPAGDSERFWREAAAELEFRRTRQELEDRITKPLVQRI
jgi:hypothetical protein